MLQSFERPDRYVCAAREKQGHLRRDFRGEAIGVPDPASEEAEPDGIRLELCDGPEDRRRVTRAEPGGGIDDPDLAAGGKKCRRHVLLPEQRGTQLLRGRGIDEQDPGVHRLGPRRSGGLALQSRLPPPLARPAYTAERSSERGPCRALA